MVLSGATINPPPHTNRPASEQYLTGRYAYGAYELKLKKKCVI